MTAELGIEQEIVVIEVEPGTERCDADIADAVVMVVLASGTLAFCGHHARKYGFLPAYV